MKKIRLRAFSLGFSAVTVLAVAAGCAARQEPGSAATADLISSPDLVISQVYGGGGNSDAPYTHDFVELFNRGSQPVSLGGKSLQYASSGLAFSKNSDVVTLPNVTLEPERYFLIQLASKTNPVGVALPAPDLVTSGASALTLANDKGKIALVSSTELLDACGTAATPCTAGAWIDFVGYGAASQSESAPTVATSNKNAVLRKDNGCADTGNNSADFALGTPAPRNASTPAAVCPTSSGDGGTGSSQDAGPGPDRGGADAAADSSGSASAEVLLNEVKINPPGGTDAPWEYAEVLCTPNASLDGYWFVALEGDGDSSTGSPGVADIVVDLGGHVCGANGLVYIKAAAGGHVAGAAQSTVITTTALDTGTSPLENATTSFVIIKSPAAITVTTDYDVENDGTLELPAGASVVDGFSVFEQADGAVDHTYAPRISLSSGTPDGASRIVGNKTPLSAAAWFAADISGTDPQGLKYDPTKATANLPSGAVLTPGAPNNPTAGSATDAGSSGSSGGPGSEEEEEGEAEEPSGEGSSEDSGTSTGSSGGKKAPRNTNSAAPTVSPARTSSGCSTIPTSAGDHVAIGVLGALVLGLSARRRRRTLASIL